MARRVRPNIVMLVTDNQSADSLGCYGNREHDTPRVDRLAREGALFLNAFCTNGLCSPTRASILTGLMPSQHGVHLAMPDDEVMAKPPDYDVTRPFRTLPYELRRHGYATAMVGKWHLGNFRQRGHGFDHWVAFTKGHTTDFYDNKVFVDGEVQRVQDMHIVDYFTDCAVDYIRDRDTTQPFFLQVNYDGPYVLPPTVVGADPRNRFYARYEHQSFRPFPRLDDRLIRSVVVPFDFGLDPGEEYTLASAFNNLWWTVRVHNDQATRANIAAQNALVDDAIGRVVDALDESGAADETLVVMTTDQGNPYGQRGLWGHPPWTDPPFVHDVTFRVPLVLRHLGVIPSQRVVDSVVSHYDLLPNLLEHVGIDTPIDRSPGRSLGGLLTGRDVGAWTDEAFFEAETARSIRTRTHLYTRHLDGTGDPECYDLVADPEQWDNVAGDPRYADVVGQLDARLQEFFATFVDPRYDLWNGGTGQAMVSRYLLYKERYGPAWDVTMDVGPAFGEPTVPAD
ncbi:MAG: sulfatase-like hydrolase/transferase [Actinomycetota bacterium]